ncbi:MAG: N-acetylmuramoyl-L-alanine amidase [Rhizobiales bacterium]|nr:N-acetylmuramoyl-L-alanine amidase [Hyphomicrobiales bacterium]
MGLALLAIVGLALPAYAENLVITAARVAGDGQRTRFVADLSAPVAYTAYVLPNPYRVVVDLPDVTFNLPPGIGEKTRGLISEYRYGAVETGRSRIVIDTKGPVLIEKTFILEPQAGQPARIVVDLVQVSAQAFSKAYAAEQKNSARAVAEAAAVPPAGAIDRSTTEPVAAEPAPPPSRSSARKLIVIDPGHGGIDPGAIGANRTREKDVVLAFGLALREALLKSGDYDVIMTRSDDRFLRLDDRVKVARDNKADLFIVVHADTVRGAGVRGATIYTLSAKASDAEAEALAQKENRADIIGGMDLGAESQEVTGILIDLAQRESKKRSTIFARKAVGDMRQVTSFTGKPMRSAGFVVLKAPDVPSVLIELGYLSSRRDEAQLGSEAWRSRTAAALTRAIASYFATEVAQRGN